MGREGKQVGEIKYSCNNWVVKGASAVHARTLHRPWVCGACALPVTAVWFAPRRERGRAPQASTPPPLPRATGESGPVSPRGKGQHGNCDSLRLARSPHTRCITSPPPPSPHQFPALQLVACRPVPARGRQRGSGWASGHGGGVGDSVATNNQRGERWRRLPGQAIRVGRRGWGREHLQESAMVKHVLWMCQPWLNGQQCRPPQAELSLCLLPRQHEDKV